MQLKSNIAKYLGFVDLDNKNSVGIEVEIEAVDEFPPQDRLRYYWKHHMDGSLRGEYNAEYVLTRPMPMGTAFKALDKLQKELGGYGTEIIDSVRAGTHVHINVGDLTFLEMWTMVTCWYVLEELLTYTMCGEGRGGNHFCLRAKDADPILNKASKALKTGDLRGLKGDDVRYSALNFVSLFKYGSLEFRAMRTPKNFEEIKEWVEVLMNLKLNSKMSPNPRHVIENFSFGGEEHFLETVLGKVYAGKVMLRDPNWKAKMRDGVRLAQELGYAVDDWDKDYKEKR